MNIAIYQVNMDRDNDNVAFMNYEKLETLSGFPPQLTARFMTRYLRVK